MRKYSLEARYKKLLQIADRIDGSKFTYVHDEWGNTTISMNDGEIITLPLVPLRPYQLEDQKAVFVDQYKRLCIVMTRQSGKEVETWQILVKLAILNTGLCIMNYPTNVMAREILWEGAIRDPATGKSIRFLEMIPSRFILKISDQSMSIKLTNGSIIRVGGSDKNMNKHRGKPIMAFVNSEYAYSDPRVWTHAILPSLTTSGGIGILQTTFAGANHAYQLYNNIKNEPEWYARVRGARDLKDPDGNRYVTDEMVEEAIRAGMSREIANQEYYCEVNENSGNYYFSEALSNIKELGKIKENIIIPGYPVYAFWDLGTDDATVVLLMQIGPNYTPYLIHCIESNNRDEVYYVNEIKQFCYRRNLLFLEHYGPHDANNRRPGTTTTYIDIMAGLGQKMHVVPRPMSKQMAISSMRQMIYRCVFDKDGADRLLQCLTNYQKEYDMINNVYSKLPKHDWTSHACFVGDTKIITRLGLCSFKDLPPTGEVLTSFGWRFYRSPRLTRSNASLMTITFNDKSTVTCTPDHLFKTIVGWQPAEALHEGMLIKSAHYLLNDWNTGAQGSAKKYWFTVMYYKLKQLFKRKKSVQKVDNQQFLTVTQSKRLINQGEVWCITVPQVQEFALANGAIVHNCDAFQTMTLAIENGMLQNDGLGMQHRTSYRQPPMPVTTSYPS